MSTASKTLENKLDEINPDIIYNKNAFLNIDRTKVRIDQTMSSFRKDEDNKEGTIAVIGNVLYAYDADGNVRPVFKDNIEKEFPENYFGPNAIENRGFVTHQKKALKPKLDIRKGDDTKKEDKDDFNFNVTEETDSNDDSKNRDVRNNEGGYDIVQGKIVFNDDVDLGNEAEDFNDVVRPELKDGLDSDDHPESLREYVNGYYEKDLSGGEYLERTRKNVVHFPPGFHGAPRGSYLDKRDITTQNIGRIMILNSCMLYSEGLDVLTCLKVSYIRVLMIGRGLISDEWYPTDLNVKYIEAFYHDDDTLFREPLKAWKVAAKGQNLTIDERKRINDEFNSLVCLVAFVFRSRGHHFKNEFLELYFRIIRNCGFDPTKLSLTPEIWSTIALHAIPPKVLDDYWLWSNSHGKCTGPLVKRINCAPAGSASIYGIYTGLSDIITLLPQLRVRYGKEIDYLERTIEYLKGHRWVGSINHRYYGEKRFLYDETRFNGLVALVLGALDVFAPDAPLSKAPSLKRVGNNAPITAAIIGNVLRSITQSPKYAESYFLMETKNRENT